MINQRLIFVVCLASITLFSLDCSGNPAEPSQPSIIAPIKGPVNAANLVASSNISTIPLTTNKDPITTKIPTTTSPTTIPTTTPNATTPPASTTEHTTVTILPPSTSDHPSTLPPNTTTHNPSTTSTTTVRPDDPKSSFDPLSFVGGIILSLGVAAISYVVYKFYKTRTDPNYRSL